tara:strand:+ start:21472 stop:21633 length:162 start_codon:yes stop_codon:yes gene_type:complete
MRVDETLTGPKQNRQKKLIKHLERQMKKGVKFKQSKQLKNDTIKVKVGMEYKK